MSVYEELFEGAVERLSVGQERYGFCLVGGDGRREWGRVEVVSVESDRRVICLDEDMVGALESASEREYSSGFRRFELHDGMYLILINPFYLRRFIGLFPPQHTLLHPKPPPLLLRTLVTHADLPMQRDLSEPKTELPAPEPFFDG